MSAGFMVAKVRMRVVWGVWSAGVGQMDEKDE